MHSKFIVDVMGKQIEIIRDDDGKFVVPESFRGIGSSLKPALEPITVARKPLVGTVAANVLAHGTGALNIDGCRIEGDDTTTRHNSSSSSYMTGKIGEVQPIQESYMTGSPRGRWPANLIHSGEPDVISLFPDAKSGNSVSGKEPSSVTNGIYGKFNGRTEFSGYTDTGSAARFFYCAKTSKTDRNEGVEGDLGNKHPTVKPVSLMQYLCRLVTPPGGVVLDPFTGSGSTGKAAVIEGFRFIGVDLSDEYVKISNDRISYAYNNREKFLVEDKKPTPKKAVAKLEKETKPTPPTIFDLISKE